MERGVGTQGATTPVLERATAAFPSKAERRSIRLVPRQEVTATLCSCIRGARLPIARAMR